MEGAFSSDQAQTLPLGFMIVGAELVTVTVTLPVAFRSRETASASGREIFWMMADLAIPVPAAFEPEF